MKIHISTARNALILIIGVFISLFANSFAFADPRYESHMIYAGSTILGTDPIETCQQLISQQSSYVPQSAAPVVVPYTAAEPGGYTSRWYDCFGQYPSHGYVNGDWVPIIATGEVGWMYAVCPPAYLVSSPYGICRAKVYLSAILLPKAECGPTCNGVGEPINPASGATYNSSDDLLASGALNFRRFYNSTDSGSLDFGPGWQHVYSRHVTMLTVPLTFKPYVAADPNNSSLYADEATACINGFAEVKSRVPGWASASVTYDNGACKLSSGGIYEGMIQLYAYQAGDFHPLSTTIGFEVTRDDGQVTRFMVNGTAITAPPSINLVLQQTASGFTITDASNNVEQYDTYGTLLNITSRAGVVQTMNYDNLGRLSSVTDSFGHQLMLGYDAQGHLTTVTR